MDREIQLGGGETKQNKKQKNENVFKMFRMSVFRQ